MSWIRDETRSLFRTRRKRYSPFATASAGPTFLRSSISAHYLSLGRKSKTICRRRARRAVSIGIDRVWEYFVSVDLATLRRRRRWGRDDGATARSSPAASRSPLSFPLPPGPFTKTFGTEQQLLGRPPALRRPLLLRRLGGTRWEKRMREPGTTTVSLVLSHSLPSLSISLHRSLSRSSYRQTPPRLRARRTHTGARGNILMIFLLFSAIRRPTTPPRHRSHNPHHDSTPSRCLRVHGVPE